MSNANTDERHLKQCKKCSQWLDRSLFHKHSQTRDKLFPYCKKCNLQQASEWASAHPLQAQARSRRHYEANRESEIQKRKARYQCAREREAKVRRQNYEQNAASYRKRAQKWKQENALQVRVHNATRKSRKRNAKGVLTKSAVDARFAYFGGKCYLCGQSSQMLHIEHVKPLSKGGTNWPSNIRPSCQECNFRKKDKWLRVGETVKHFIRRISEYTQTPALGLLAE